jgi:hypothetical protein
MAVIGRLDDQVEEIIIAPIARRHEQKNRQRERERQEPDRPIEKTPATNDTPERGDGSK